MLFLVKHHNAFKTKTVFKLCFKAFRAKCIETELTCLPEKFSSRGMGFCPLELLSVLAAATCHVG